MPLRASSKLLYPRGPRSGPGYSVPVHQHLLDPIRPSRRLSTTSPHSGLYALSSLCTQLPGCLGDLREVPCFRWPTFSTCRPPRPREAHRLHVSSSFTDDAGLTNACETLGASNPPTLRFSWESAISRLDYGSRSLRLADLLALLSELTGLAPSQRGLLLPGFQRIGHPHRRRV
jgi:hypothetical protein